VKLRCAYGCGHEVSILAGHVECPRCGGLLDPVLDVAKHKKTSAAQWREAIEARATSTKPADRSGVWRFQPWVLPEVKARDIVTLGEGNAPLVEGPAVMVGKGRVVVKQCGQQPTGSFKDLGMTVLVSAASAMRMRGHDVKALVCASTGDTSAALAAYGARAGIPVVVLLPAGKVSPAQLVQPLAHGAHVVEIEGDFDACMRVVKEVGKRPGFFLANSRNPLRLLGQATVAYEVVRDLGWKAPDVVVVPSGNLGNIGAMFMGFQLLQELKLIRKLPRLVAAQVAAADPLHRATPSRWEKLVPVRAGETIATAIRIGDPVSFPRAKAALLATNGITTSSSEDDVVRAMDALDRTGIYACPQTGAAMAGVQQLAKSGFIGKDDLTVLVSTASGLKFSEVKARATTNVPARAGASVDDVVRALGVRGVAA
jgi:threonine synthase